MTFSTAHVIYSMLYFGTEVLTTNNHYSIEDFVIINTTNNLALIKMRNNDIKISAEVLKETQKSV